MHVSRLILFSSFSAVFIFVMMFGTIFVVQVFVLIVFGTMRVCDTVFG